MSTVRSFFVFAVAAMILGLGTAARSSSHGVHLKKPLPKRNVILYVYNPEILVQIPIPPLDLAGAAAFKIEVRDSSASSALRRVASVTEGSKDRWCRWSDYRALIAIPNKGKVGFHHWAVSPGGLVLDVERGRCGKISKANARKVFSVTQLFDVMKRSRAK